MATNRVLSRELDTYVYIDVSNIRLACLKTLGLRIDFARLLRYLRRKYPRLREARYYEGIAKGDTKKRRRFGELTEMGYVVCGLERKSYVSEVVERRVVRCPRCGSKWEEGFRRERRTLKSNVDVYLAADMVARASVVRRPTRLILVSCDGDYAEAIRIMLGLNDGVSVTVMATPYLKDVRKNTLSTRLRELAARSSAARFTLSNIADIRDLIRVDGGEGSGG